MSDAVTRPWDRDVQDIADQLVMGVDFEQGVRYIGELADLVMRERARIAEDSRTIQDLFARIAELERQLADAIPLDAFTLPGVSGGMAPPPEGHYYGDACLPNGHGVYWTVESAKQEER